MMPWFAPNDMSKRSLILPIAAAFLISAAVAGYAIQGAAGVFLFPLAIISATLCLGITWFIVDCVVTYQRHAARVAQVRARVSRLSTAELQEIAATPSHPDFGFAFVALARRGIQAKPELKSLLDMLVSSDASVRGRGLSYLFAFYPQVRFQNGASSSDSPEIWRERISRMAPVPTASATEPPRVDCNLMQ